MNQVQKKGIPNPPRNGARVTPAERPPSLFARVAYFVSRRRYGKVVTPLTVYARHTPTLLASGAMELTLDQSKLPADLIHLVQLRAAMRIGCPF